MINSKLEGGEIVPLRPEPWIIQNRIYTMTLHKGLAGDDNSSVVEVVDVGPDEPKGIVATVLLQEGHINLRPVRPVSDALRVAILDWCSLVT